MNDASPTGDVGPKPCERFGEASDRDCPAGASVDRLYPPLS